MALDPATNFAKSVLAAGIDADDTSIDVTSGDGAKFPAPASAGAFNVIIWEKSTYQDPADDPNHEIVRVTARSTDNMTITRAQEGTSAATHNTGGATYGVMLVLSALMITNIKNDLGYTLRGYTPGGSTTDMAASSSYYFGTQQNYYMGTTANLNTIYIPRAGTITVCSIILRTGSVASSGESATFYIRKNNTTDYSVATFTLGATNTLYSGNYTGLAIPVAAGDYVEFKIATPAWTTLPKIPGVNACFFVN